MQVRSVLIGAGGLAVAAALVFGGVQALAITDEPGAVVNTEPISGAFEPEPTQESVETPAAPGSPHQVVPSQPLLPDDDWDDDDWDDDGWDDDDDWDDE